MLALVGTAMLRSASGNLLLSDSDEVLGTHSPTPHDRRRTGAGQAPRPAPHPMKTGASAAAPPGRNGRPDRITRGPPDWVPTRVELPGSVSTYLPSLARSTSGVWCPRVGDPRSGPSRHRSSSIPR
jgi:hypothetical protein